MRAPSRRTRPGGAFVRVVLASALALLPFTLVRAQGGDFVPLEDRPAVPALATRISVRLRDVPLADAVEEITRKAKLGLTYERALAGLDRRTTLVLDSVPAVNALLRVLESSPLRAMVSPQGTIVLVARPAPPPRPATRHAAGAVRDASTGLPIPGARVELVGTRHETLSRDDGTFSLGTVSAVPHTVRVTRLGYRPALLTAPDGAVDALAIALEPAPISLASVLVTPGYYGLLQPTSAAQRTMTREQIDATPQIGEDIYRVVTRLPGVAASDFSSSFIVRGAPAEELYATLDGLELIEPFHLRDIGGALSIIDAQAIGSVELTSGGATADIGDRLTGAFTLRTIDPLSEPAKTSLGLSLMNARVTTRGAFASGRGGWLLSARRGYVDLAIRASGVEDSLSPRYHDLFAKVVWDLGRAGRASAHVLNAGDALRYDEGDDEPGLRSRYGSRYAWLTWEAPIGRRVRQQSVASIARLTWRRDGLQEGEFGRWVDLADRRALDQLKLRTDWSMDIGRRALLRWGADVTGSDATYDYASEVRQFAIENGQLVERTVSVDVEREASATRVGAWLSNRIRPLPSLTLEAGARWDRSTQSGDGRLDPRLNLAWQPREGTTIRGAWGRTSQAQPLQSLQVQDGVDEFAPMERAEHRVVGVEQLLPAGILARVEGYERRYRSQRPRFLSSGSAIAMFPELRWDRTRIEPGPGRARGVELYVSREAGTNVDWSFAYSLSTVADSIEDRLVPRATDQRHALQGLWSIHPESNRWRLSIAGSWHSGWPYTPPIVRVDSVRTSSGGLAWVTNHSSGPLYSERLEAYHRIDVRWTRWFDTRAGRLALFAEVFNLLGTENERGRNVNTEIRGTTAYYTTGSARMLPRIPSIGFAWEFGGSAR